MLLITNMIKIKIGLWTNGQKCEGCSF